MKPITALFLASFVLLAVLHWLALELLLYWRFWWADIITHVLGGAVAIMGLYSLKDMKLWPHAIPLTLLSCFGLIVLIAVSWEVFWKSMELFGYSFNKDDYVADTTLDILVGMVGGYIGYVIASKLTRE